MFSNTVAGALSLPDHQRLVATRSAAVFDAVADLGVLRVQFGIGTSELLTAMRTSAPMWSASTTDCPWM